MYNYLKTLSPDLQLVKGDFDISLSVLPQSEINQQQSQQTQQQQQSTSSWPIPTALSKVVTHGSLRIGFTHGHMIIPPGDPDSLLISARQMDVDIFCWGGTSRFEAYELEGKFFINPGSATGAASWSGEDLSEENKIDDETGEQKEICPSFVLMDIQGDVLILYVYQLKKDSNGNESVVVEKVSYKKGGGIV